ncbi:MAG: hypothetical protein ABSA41_20815 [Terriglobia bacterium]|jgi:hypothetical protein
MNQEENLPAILRKAQKDRLVERLPITFQPFLNQEISHWGTKFPYEQRYLESLIGFIDGLSPEGLADLFRGVRKIESSMGISEHQFSAHEQTMREASILSRSPYYLEWRREIDRVFQQIDHSTFAEEQARASRLNRLLLLIFPAALPVDPQSVMEQWQRGRLLRMDWPAHDPPERSVVETVLKGPPRADGEWAPGFLEEYASRPGRSFADIWVLEPGTRLRTLLNGLQSAPPEGPRAALLSFDRLKAFREGVLEHIKSMARDISDADAIYAKLRSLDVSDWCPPEVGNIPAVREFIRALFLTGNGSPLFSSAFVEWGAVEAMHHARPTVLVAEFGLRNKPKPFTSVAVFENQEKATPQPPVPDPENSAVDAVILAYYTWLGAARYVEYQRAACLCLFERTPYALVAGAEEFPLWQEKEPVAPQRIAALLQTWLA